MTTNFTEGEQPMDKLTETTRGARTDIAAETIEQGSKAEPKTIVVDVIHMGGTGKAMIAKDLLRQRSQEKQ